MRPMLFAPFLLASGLALSAAAAPYRVAMLEIEGDPPSASSAMSMFAEPSPTVLEYADALRDASSDDGVSGVIVRLKDAALSTTDIAELGQAMDDFRAGGKDLYLFAEAFGTAELLAGCHADHVILQQGGGVTQIGAGVFFHLAPRVHPLGCCVPERRAARQAIA